MSRVGERQDIIYCLSHAAPRPPLGEREGAHVLQDRVSPGPHRPSCYPMGVHYPPRMASLMGVVAHFGVHIRWVLLPTRSFDKPAAG